MNAQEFQAALALAEAEPKGDWQLFPEGKTLTLHVASNGVGLSVPKVEAVRVEGSQVQARNTRGDVFAVLAADVFACVVDGGEMRGRKAGFSP